LEKGNNTFTSFLALLKVKHTKTFSDRYFNEYIWRGKDTTNTIPDFLNAWSGIILLAEPSENAGEPNYKANRKKELLHATQQYRLLSVTTLLLVLACITNNLFTTPVPTVPIVLTVLNLSGIYTSYLLVQKQLHIHNQYLIAVYLEKGMEKTWQIYSDWFEKGYPLKEAFFKELNLKMDNPAIETEFQKHAAWKEKSRLRATPAILVNGYQLPDNYKIEDLRYFTEFTIDVK
jgi:hypothetical protein